MALLRRPTVSVPATPDRGQGLRPSPTPTPVPSAAARSSLLLPLLCPSRRCFPLLPAVRFPGGLSRPGFRSPVPRPCESLHWDGGTPGKRLGGGPWKASPSSLGLVVRKRSWVLVVVRELSKYRVLGISLENLFSDSLPVKGSVVGMGRRTGRNTVISKVFWMLDHLFHRCKKSVDGILEIFPADLNCTWIYFSFAEK